MNKEVVDTGCYVYYSWRNTRGICNAIIEVAIDHGFIFASKYYNDEDLWNVATEAENYLNDNHAPEGYYWGENHDGSAFGLWKENQ